MNIVMASKAKNAVVIALAALSIVSATTWIARTPLSVVNDGMNNGDVVTVPGVSDDTQQREDLRTADEHEPAIG